MQRTRVEEQHAALERLGRAALQALAAAEVDVERRHARRLEREPQRRAPLVELAGHPFEVLRRQVARVHELQDEDGQVRVLDRRGAPAVGADRLALDPAAAGEREQRVQLGPLGRDPLLVAIEPDLRLEAEVDDLPGDDPGQERLPLAALSVVGDVVRERRVREQERLRHVEERGPQLVLDARAPARVLDVLGGERLAHGLRERVGAEHRFERGGRARAAALGDRPQRAHELGVRRERVARGLRGEPALGRSRVGERIPRGLAESEHDGRVGAGVARRAPRGAAGAPAPAPRSWRSWRWGGGPIFAQGAGSGKLVPVPVARIVLFRPCTQPDRPVVAEIAGCPA